MLKLDVVITTGNKSGDGVGGYEYDDDYLYI